MTCPSCTEALRNPRADTFTSGCMSCEARALAVTRADLVEDYRGAVERVFGKRAKEGHRLVKEWLARVKGLNVQRGKHVSQ